MHMISRSQSSERLNDLPKTIVDLKSDSQTHNLATQPCSQDPALKDFAGLQAG